MKDKVKIGIAQMKILSDFFVYENRDKNVSTAITLIEELMKTHKDIDMIVLPEEFYAGAAYGPFSLPDSMDDIKDKVFNKLGKIAKKYRVYICGGLCIKINPDEVLKSNNVGFIIDRDGVLAGLQERIHRNPTESPYSFSGEKCEVFNLDFGRVGIVLGLDIMYPEITRKFALAGAEIILSPIINPGIERKNNDNSCFPNDLYVECAVARAIENQIFVVMVNSVGKFIHSDLNLIGESIAAGPRGKILKCGNKDKIEVVELDIKHIEEAKKIFNLLEIRDKSMCQIGEEI